jgi:hypothetical protein
MIDGGWEKVALTPFARRGAEAAHELAGLLFSQRD